MNIQSTLRFAFVALILCCLTPGCKKEKGFDCEPLQVANANLTNNIKKYETVWDEIINHGKIDLINQQMFEKNVVLVTSPKNIVGIDAFKDYYKNFLTGFSEIKFTIIDTYGQDDRIVKHWRFEGKHTGVFFGIPATGKTVNIEGVTLVKMKNGKIAQEQDFMDNLEFMNQLGLIPRE